MDIRLIYYMIIYSQLIYSCPLGIGGFSETIKKVLCNQSIETKFKAPISRKQEALNEINKIGSNAILVEIRGGRYKEVPLKLKYLEDQ